MGKYQRKFVCVYRHTSMHRWQMLNCRSLYVRKLQIIIVSTKANVEICMRELEYGKLSIEKEM